MNRIVASAVAGLLAVASFGVSVASASGSDVIRRGSCTGESDWKLKLSPEDGRIEVEFEVDQNVVGDTWRVRMKHNGEPFFRGKRVTRAPSGSFEVRGVEKDLSGTDRFVARAVNLSTDEVCRGTAGI